MNENKENNNSTVRPYKATANLNTAIGNPSVNINDTMNINIQTMATNNQMPNNTVKTNNGMVQTNSGIEEQKYMSSQTNNTIPSQTIMPQQNATSSSYVKKTYVSADNKKTKKKSVTFSVNSEFKIALLIIVVLLVFVFLLPIISEMLGGY